jgi:hypothetical protein
MCHSDQPGDGGTTPGRSACGGNMLAADATPPKHGVSLRSSVTSLRLTVQSFLQARRNLKGI